MASFPQALSSERAFFICSYRLRRGSLRSREHIMDGVKDMKKMIFRSMSTALAASDVLRTHGIVSRPIRGGSAKCGCCVELALNGGSFSEAERILDAHAFRFEVSE